jgi:hypothetical protein
MVSSGNGPGKRKESAVDDYYDIESLFDDPEQDDEMRWNLQQGLGFDPKGRAPVWKTIAYGGNLGTHNK